MFGMSMTEILMIVVLALVVLGPEKLPKMAKMLGKGMRELRRATSDIRQAIEIDDIRAQIQSELRTSPTRDHYAQAAKDDAALDDGDALSDDTWSCESEEDCWR